jgi:transcriptional regulator with XRE-family HTH domain
MKLKILKYNSRHDTPQKEFIMPRKRIPVSNSAESFGERLTRFRQAAGFSQRDLAAEIGISQRMVAYYEKETEHPPTHLLSILARALGVTADQLLGTEKVKDNGKQRDNRLWRRFSQVEKLPPTKRKQIVQILDAFLGTEKLKKN